MNTNQNGEGNTEIPEVEDLIIEDTDDIDTIKSKTETHNQQVKAYKEYTDSQNSQLYSRTKKAEGFELIDGKWVKSQKPNKKDEPNAETTTSPKDGLSSADIITIMKNNVPEEDIDEVVEYAKFKKIPLADALKDNVVRTILADKAEQRKVAEGTDTGGGRRGSSRLSDDALISNARAGKMPESDDDMKRLTILLRAKK